MEVVVAQSDVRYCNTGGGGDEVVFLRLSLPTFWLSLASLALGRLSLALTVDCQRHFDAASFIYLSMRTSVDKPVSFQEVFRGAIVGGGSQNK